MLNRSAIVVKPRQPFLDWLHTADPTSRNLSLRELVQEPTIYLIPECERKRTSGVSCKNCARKFLSSNWRVGSGMKAPGLRTAVLMSSAVGLISDTIRCWWTSAMNY